MDKQKFDAAVKEITIKEEHMRQIKTSDYGADLDIFQSIRTIGEEIDIAPAKVLLTFLHKHINSIYKAIKENELRPVCYAEALEERIMDARAYLMLLLLFLQENGEEPLKTDSFKPKIKRKSRVIALKELNNES